MSAPPAPALARAPQATSAPGGQSQPPARAPQAASAPGVQSQPLPPVSPSRRQPQTSVLSQHAASTVDRPNGRVMAARTRLAMPISSSWQGAHREAEHQAVHVKSLKTKREELTKEEEGKAMIIAYHAPNKPPLRLVDSFPHFPNIEPLSVPILVKKLRLTPDTLLEILDTSNLAKQRYWYLQAAKTAISVTVSRRTSNTLPRVFIRLDAEDVAWSDELCPELDSELALAFDVKRRAEHLPSPPLKISRPAPAVDIASTRIVTPHEELVPVHSSNAQPEQCPGFAASSMTVLSAPPATSVAPPDPTPGLLVGRGTRTKAAQTTWPYTFTVAQIQHGVKRMNDLIASKSPKQMKKSDAFPVIFGVRLASSTFHDHMQYLDNAPVEIRDTFAAYDDDPRGSWALFLDAIARASACASVKSEDAEASFASHVDVDASTRSSTPPPSGPPAPHDDLEYLTPSPSPINTSPFPSPDLTAEERMEMEDDPDANESDAVDDSDEQHKKTHKEISSSPAPTLCHFCDEPMPPSPSAALLERQATLLERSWSEPNAANPAHRDYDLSFISFNLFENGFCPAHRRESVLADQAARSHQEGIAYPVHIDFLQLGTRLPQFIPILATVIRDPHDNEFFLEAQKMFKPNAHLHHRMAEMNRASAGFYGERGYAMLLMFVLKTCQDTLGNNDVLVHRLDAGTLIRPSQHCAQAETMAASLFLSANTTTSILT
ncbi:hypothetical protein C8Q80DRAFT_762157 [Daedaleopsis nitida]|nr:hypothetical protein C8Q80DRAFT_762157 [Daedaleopsis nitida]